MIRFQHGDNLIVKAHVKHVARRKWPGEIHVVDCVWFSTDDERAKGTSPLKECLRRNYILEYLQRGKGTSNRIHGIYVGK
jgi:hypothetical protein